MGKAKSTSFADDQVRCAGASGVDSVQTITASEWGGVHIESIKKIADEQSDVDINWQTIAGAINILPKIRAAWPQPGIDLVAGYEASFQEIARQNWAEPVTAANVPNIVDVPEKLLMKDSGGNIINIPRTITATLWFCRQDIMPFEITQLDDLLDPRLKGKICFPALTINSGLQLLSLALYQGGDERNIEPAWEFIKKLARSGNIGRVAKSGSEVVNTISSGESCLTFECGTHAIELARKFKIRYLIKMDPQKTGFWTYLAHHGWCVLKGGNTDAAFKFANFVIGPERNAEFNQLVGGIPANIKSKVSDEAKLLAFNNEEIERYTYIPDWSYLTEQSGAWLDRWEQEVAPLL
ncbi:extracellular solute-binding protein [Bradyrhizobium sp. LLZ17]|uniref:Extracellular solute-binding protein n=1 Tax=Bradyrhizobium sp. LLZ17 TaxID=3239388 RepID=A0AB39XTZ6_9BRAD